MTSPAINMMAAGPAVRNNSIIRAFRLAAKLRLGPRRRSARHSSSVARRQWQRRLETRDLQGQWSQAAAVVEALPHTKHHHNAVDQPPAAVIEIDADSSLLRLLFPSPSLTHFCSFTSNRAALDSLLGPTPSNCRQLIRTSLGCHSDHILLATPVCCPSDAFSHSNE